jgi:hypothetical protein
MSENTALRPPAAGGAAVTAQNQHEMPPSAVRFIRVHDNKVSTLQDDN